LFNSINILLVLLLLKGIVGNINFLLIIQKKAWRHPARQVGGSSTTMTQPASANSWHILQAYPLYENPSAAAQKNPPGKGVLRFKVTFLLEKLSAATLCIDE
jgi:hypothetical protein